MTLQERIDDMVDRYGECCTRTKAAQILGRSREFIYAALKDGRLETVCGGDMVDVRSIAAYICEPKKADFNARMKKVREKRGSNWSV